MRVVVTGGTGLIGRELVRQLAEDGHRSLVLSRRPERAGGFPAGTEVAAWDGVSAEQFTERLAGADAVIHLAGESIAGGRWTEARKARIRSSRVVSTSAVVAAIAAAERPPEVLIQGSAVGYYGPRGDEEITETSPPGDDFLASVCREWEAAGAPVEERGVRRVIARTGVVLATDGGALPRMLLPFKLFVGGPVGDGRQWFPWIHLADEAAALAHLLRDGKASGAFNLTAPQPLTNGDFSRVLGRVLHRPSFLPAPALAFKLALGEMSVLLLEGQRAIPQRLQELGFSFRFAAAEPALRDLLG